MGEATSATYSHDPSRGDEEPKATVDLPCSSSSPMPRPAATLEPTPTEDPTRVMPFHSSYRRDIIHDVPQVCN